MAWISRRDWGREGRERSPEAVRDVEVAKVMEKKGPGQHFPGLQ